MFKISYTLQYPETLKKSTLAYGLNEWNAIWPALITIEFDGTLKIPQWEMGKFLGYTETHGPIKFSDWLLDFLSSLSEVSKLSPQTPTCVVSALDSSMEINFTLKGEIVEAECVAGHIGKFTVGRDELMKESAGVIRTFLKTILDINPKLESDRNIARLKNALQKLENQ